jgi:hypothetical protein
MQAVVGARKHGQIFVETKENLSSEQENKDTLWAGGALPPNNSGWSDYCCRF